MRLARAWSVSLVGLKATMVEVEVFFGSGLPRTILVGLTDMCVQESRERCRAAVASTGLPWPVTSVTIALSPADVHKSGSHFDLPIVAAVLGAAEVFPREELERTVLMGELSLDGRVRPVRGVLPALLAAQHEGFEQAIVPMGQVHEARLVPGLTVRGVAHLRDLVALLRGQPVCEPPLPPAVDDEPTGVVPDLADVVGQADGKWALEVAAAGGHHLWFVGPPGVGKTLLAQRLPGILPDLSLSEAQEVSAIYSLLGHSLEHGLITRPPFSAPHHSVSVAALVGGGNRVASPGAISRAHRGVLFLDEAPEFSVRAMEALRQPLESGWVEHARVQAQTHFPARFQLVLASNPCPCGWYGIHGATCRCAPMTVRRYADRISGPIADRIDIQLPLAPMPGGFLKIRPAEEPSAVVAERVARARARQRRRLAPYGLSTNAEVPGSLLRGELRPRAGLEIVHDASDRGLLSARGIDKVLRLAWTLADLADVDQPGRSQVQAALMMRRGEPREVRCA